jgi:hypothetical protein
VSACMELEVEEVRGKGRGRKTLGACVRDDMKMLGLRKEDAQYRVIWKDLTWKQPLIFYLLFFIVFPEDICRRFELNFTLSDVEFTQC